MANKFKGFTTQQQADLLKRMGHDVPAQQDDIDKFLAASPGAAASLGRYALLAQQRVGGQPLSGTLAMANGGVVDKPQSRRPPKKSDEEIHKAETAQAERELLTGSLKDPSAVLEPVEEARFSDAGVSKGQISASAGQAQQRAGVGVATAQMPDIPEVVTYDPTLVSEEVKQEVGGLEAAKGEVSQQVEAQAQDPEALAQLNLQVAQAQAAEIAAVNPRELQPGEAVEGTAVDMQAVDQALEIEAAQADPSKKATVKGQLEGLMTEFEGGNTPAWAAGAMRQANAALVARGVGASSMAGQAVIQATMEAAVPIAQADAQTFAKFELTNLSNRQQATMFAAQQRAEFLGQKFDQEFQTRVLNAAKISEIANLNFTAEQQVALENARLANTVNVANMNSENAKVLSDAAAMSQMETANLNNRQQTQVQNAQNFLQIDMANLSNEQQTALFKAQQMTNALLSDQAASNAAAQFNAASENQANQFMAELSATVSRFNAEQTNDMSKFNANLQAERDKFNANNQLVIAQANAKWRQDMAVAEFQSQHEANMTNAQTYNNLTTAQLDQLWQKERDIMAFAFTGGENAADRELQMLLGDKSYSLQQQQMDADKKAGYGALAATVLFGSGGGGGLLGGLF